MPPPSSPSLRSVPHIGPLTPFPRHPQASTGGRHRRCLKDVLRTCQETLTYSTHLPRTLSVCLPLLLKSSIQYHWHPLRNLLCWLVPSSCDVGWKVDVGLDSSRCLYDCRGGHVRLRKYSAKPFNDTYLWSFRPITGCWNSPVIAVVRMCCFIYQ